MRMMRLTRCLETSAASRTEQVGCFHPQTLPIPLLQARQNLFRVGTGTDLGKGLCDPALGRDQHDRQRGRASAVAGP